MNDEELRDGLVKFSRRVGFTLREIFYMARMILQADVDPLSPEEWGEPFDFPERKLSVLDDEFDFHCINAEVPKPDAQVDLAIAWKEFLRDLQSVAAIHASHPDLPFRASRLIFNNHFDWLRFWSARHPDAEAKAKFKRRLSAASETYKRLAAKSDAILRKRGVEMLEA
jgi:hypothetical protein